MPNTFVALVGEDELCMAVLKKLINQFNPTLCIHYEFVTRGYGNIKNNISRYVQASNNISHIILTDLDQYPCPLSLIHDWNIPNTKRENFIFRIAVKEVEAWLLADRVGFANFLKVNPQVIPPYPEEIVDPKQHLLKIASRSRVSGLARDLLPTKNSTAIIGPLYNERLTKFISDTWNAATAAENSNSLLRAIKHIQEINTI